MAYVHQLADQYQIRRLFQIFADKAGPLFFVFIIGFCEPVTGKIHQIKLCPVFRLLRYPLGIQPVKIQRLCLAGGRTDPGQPVPAADRIDQRRLAYIGTPYKRYFRQIRFGILFRTDCRSYKFRTDKIPVFFCHARLLICSGRRRTISGAPYDNFCALFPISLAM